MERDRYRYMLTRTIAPLLAGDAGDALLFVMLNPSTADERVDDPTIRRCIGFAAREGAPLLQVVNLYAYRATDPAELARAVEMDVDVAVGAGNDDVLESALAMPHVRIVCAWGSHPMAARAMSRFARIHRQAHQPALWCLGTTRSGAPRHPLYVRADAPLIPFEVRGA